jgi:hypothetical protein
MAQAFAQDVVNEFNPKYKPQGSEEKDLFTLQLYYVYAIFCSNLKMDFGQKLVRDYESSQNTQAIWKELSNDAEKSMVAQLNATDLLQYTHTAQVKNWKGTTLSFILHYQEQIRLYDQLQPPNEQTSDHAKMIYLQNAVYAIEELRSVQTTGSQLALANDISPLLCFHFWEPVYYKLDDSDFLSDSREKRGHFIGISESVRHIMTFKILTDNTLKVIH